MRKSLIEKDQRWKVVPGTDGKYLANPDGQLCHLTKKGKKIITEGYMHKHRCHRYVAVKMTLNGKATEHKLSRVIWETFHGPIPEGMGVVHIDRILTNNKLSNLVLMTKEQSGNKYGKLCADRIVMKVAPDGEVEEIYRSAREAARQNHMSYQTVLDRCNHKVKKPFALDGYNYLWESDATGIKDGV